MFEIFDLLFGIDIFLDSKLQDVEAQKSMHWVDPSGRRSRCRTTECRISMPKKRSRYQKGDLDKTSRYQEKTHPTRTHASKKGSQEALENALRRFSEGFSEGVLPWGFTVTKSSQKVRRRVLPAGVQKVAPLQKLPAARVQRLRSSP